MAGPDVATIHALRSDLALQISRHLRRRGLNQLAAAKRFKLPQPTLSKIANGRVEDLSLELLIRIAVRTGLPLVLQTGLVPEEAGVFVSAEAVPDRSVSTSGLADAARVSLRESTRHLTPEQRLAAFLAHTKLLGALHQAGHAAEAVRVQRARRPR